MRGTLIRRENGEYDYRVGADVNPRMGTLLSSGGCGSKTRRDAERALRHAVAAADNGRTARASSQTLAQFVEPWQCADLVRGLPTTSVNYGNSLRYVVPNIGDSKLLQHLAAVCVNLRNGRLLNGRVRGQGGLSPSTALNISPTLHRAVRDAVGWDRTHWATHPGWWPR